MVRGQGLNRGHAAQCIWAHALWIPVILLLPHIDTPSTSEVLQSNRDALGKVQRITGFFCQTWMFAVFQCMWPHLDEHGWIIKKYCLVLVFLCLLEEVKQVENTLLACNITFCGDDKVNFRNVNSHTKNTHTHTSQKWTFTLKWKEKQKVTCDIFCSECQVCVGFKRVLPAEFWGIVLIMPSIQCLCAAAELFPFVPTPQSAPVTPNLLL